MGELKPCPFCGSSMVDRFTSRCRSHYVAECGGCGASAPEERWNRRTHPQPVTPEGGEVGLAARNERLFIAACEMLAAISDALGLDPDGDPDSIIDAIEELKAAYPPVADAALSVTTMNNIRQVLANVSMRNFTSLDERHHIDAAFGLIRELDAAIDAALNRAGDRRD